MARLGCALTPPLPGRSKRRRGRGPLGPPSLFLLLALGLSTGGCRAAHGADKRLTVRFWGLGREGEVARELVVDFERRNPWIRLEVQQVPWTAAHEKLLTAFVGRATPDVAQMGNTWIPEFAAIGALEKLDNRIAGSTSISNSDYFPGVWQTSVYEGAVYGIPWYVDTRVLFYRPDLLALAGFATPPRDWQGWLEAMRRIHSRQGTAGFSILLPTNEWEQVSILGLQRGSTLLCDRETRGCFEEPAFAEAAGFYVGIFRENLAPIVGYTQFGNVYQEFERGNVAMWLTGPWNMGEFRRRLPAEHQNLWMTAPLPAPRAEDWPGSSFAGGSSLALFQDSHEKEAAWRLIEFLSDPAVQIRFHLLSGDLPARKTAWTAPSLAGDVKARAFREQLEHVSPMPRVPEWEQIAQKLANRLEPAIRGTESVEHALVALDADVDRILEKRRWMLAHRRISGR